MEEYVVKTSLHVQPFAKHALEALVLKRSKIESHANLVYTLMLLRRYESGLPFTKMFVSQSAVGGVSAFGMLEKERCTTIACGI